ncbi:MAG TPA: carboxylating nicotinate-nucleotide diphosphorylase [Nitrospirales bacterium]|jgi:nicotinate-nucleotide pyrophosphorylase (carboxylating)|nr:carboxylating nicotinate-nucleotide diphosphorylase [Nitrospirales bacterium]
MNFRDIVARALAEDLGAGDVTTQALFRANVPASGTIIAEETEGLVLAGLAVAVEVFAQVDPSLACSSSFAEGDRVPVGTTVLTVTGDGRSILQGERVALNFLQRLSGIATLTAKFCDAVKGFKTRIVDTRKTTPGLRVLEKWSVTLGGGWNHRHSLADGVLIKDNHLALVSGDVARACRLARERAPHGLKIEVEAQSLDAVKAALDGGADIILLDNMEVPAIRKAVELIKGRAMIEVSGGVTLSNVREIAAAGPDIISVGALTHSAPAVNLSMDIVPK